MQQNIWAGIVTYNPELERLQENVSSIISQVSRVVIVDNGSTNIHQLQNIYGEKHQSKIQVVANSKNQGIARALNQIIEICQKEGVNWVVTLDQDSVAPAEMVQTLAEYCQLDVGMVGPCIKDRNRIHPEEIEGSCQEEEAIITSGALTQVAAVQQVGGFDTQLFIDEVDNEMCYRLYLGGYKILKTSNTCLLHELGRQEAIYIFPKFGKLFDIDFFKRPKYLSNHPDWRKYYIVRNNIYVLRKYRGTGAFHWKNKRKNFIKNILIWILYEPFSLGKYKAIIKGFIDGFRMNITKKELVS